MTGPIRTLVFCLILVIAALGWGAWERHQGAVAERDRATADSLLGVSKTRQDSILRADSLATERGRVVRDSLNVRLRALQRDYGASRKHVDSLETALQGDSVAPSDSVGLLIASFRGERAKADRQIATLAADTLALVGQLAHKDSVIAGLTVSLAEARAGWAKAIQPQSPGLLSRAVDLATKGLALYGAVRLLGH